MQLIYLKVFKIKAVLFWPFYSKKSQKKSTIQLKIIRIISWSANQHIRQGSRLILPPVALVATNFLSWSHKHIIWSQVLYLFIWYNIWLINACWWTFIIVYSYVYGNESVQHSTRSFKRKDNCLFCLSIHLSLFKTKTKDGFIVILN